LNFGLSFALIYSAIREMTAGFATIILALTPLLTFLFAVFHQLERFRWRALAGALLALAGIALAFAGQADGGVPSWSVLFMIGGAACFAESTVVIKMLPGVSPVVVNGLGMLAATMLLFVLSLVAGEAWVWPEKSETWAAIIYLILFGSVVLFYLLVYVIQHWTASASSYLMVLSPFVAVPLGAVLAGEEVSAGLLAGAVLVVAGALVGVLSIGPVRKTRLQSTSADS
jgi:drug/metabolite transporter (DMT)-like permease